MISPLHLKFQKCPAYPFVQQTFDLELWLVNDSGKLQLRQEVPFTLKLGFEGEIDAKCDHLFEVVEGTRKIEQNGKCLLKVRLLDVSSSFGDARFVFHANPLPPSSEAHKFVGQGRGISAPMICVRQRLVVENRSQIPALWFKDKGGKQNCIEIVVKLSDEKGQAVRRQIPLKVQLCYAPSGEVVNRQNILEISRDSKLQINEDGFATLRVRINEVSMRHDGKSFSFSISPDTLKDPNSADVAPLTCSHVEVRSKITIPKNKRGIDEVGGDHHYQHQGMLPSTTPQPPVLPPHPSYTSNSAPFPHIIDNTQYSQVNEEESPLKKKRTVRFTEEELPSASTSASTTNSNPNVQLTDDLIQWSQTVMETLNRMKWTETGREKVTERSVEGVSVEVSRPVFAISNPNDLIEELMSSYEKLSHVHPELPPRSTSLDSLFISSTDCEGNLVEKSAYPCNSPFGICSASDATDFGTLPPLDANYPENSLSWGIVDAWTGAG